MTDILLPTVWPTLRARDGRRLIDFLLSLGFEETTEHADGDQIAHAEFLWPGGGGVMLGSVREDNPWPQQPGCSGVYVVTDDIDGVPARAVAAGGEVLEPPTNRDYGSRECVVRDPERGLWSFGTYRGASRG